MDSEQINHSLKKFFNEVLHELKLEATSLEHIQERGSPGKGLFLSIKLSETLVIRAPFNKWKKKLTTLFRMIRVYVAYAFCRRG